MLDTRRKEEKNFVFRESVAVSRESKKRRQTEKKSPEGEPAGLLGYKPPVLSDIIDLKFINQLYRRTV
jgi:hypothetical protein